MPVYEYHCKHCHSQYEKTQGIKDAPLRVCTICGFPSIDRVIYPPALDFRGNGWTPRST